MFSLEYCKFIRTTVWLLVALLASPSARALAMAPADAEREAHASMGRRYVEGGRYHDAISEYRKAYELKADPEFLFAIAGCYRRLENTERALFFYRRYVSTAPTGPNRNQADQAIAALAPADLNLPAAAAEENQPAPSLSNDVVIVPLPQPPPHRLWRRWWLWTAVGVIALAGTAAVLTGRGGDDRTSPATALGNMRY